MPKLTLVITEDQIEEIKAIFVEGEFAARWQLIETYHRVGAIIQGIKGKELQDVAKKIGRSYRTLRYCLEFYEQFPTLDQLPEGKNISMNKIIRKYLTNGKEQDEHTHEFITICKICYAPLSSETAHELIGA